MCIVPITEVQKSLRRKHLGASDAAAVLGLSPWKTPYEVWLEKTTDMDDLEPTAAMEWGNKLEGAIIDATAERIGVKVRKNQRRVARNGILAANCDALTIEGDLPVEVKASSKPEEWGLESGGLDSVPLQYAVQLLQQCICTDAGRGYLGVFLMGFRPELRVYELDASDDIFKGLEDRLCGWWTDHVVAGVAPPIDPANPPDLDTLRRVKRTSGEVATLDPALMTDWRKADEQAKAAVNAADALKAQVVASLGTAEEGTSEAGGVTFYEQSRKEYTVAASTYRVLRFKKGGVA